MGFPMKGRAGWSCSTRAVATGISTTSDGARAKPITSDESSEHTVKCNLRSPNSMLGVRPPSEKMHLHHLRHADGACDCIQLLAQNVASWLINLPLIADCTTALTNPGFSGIFRDDLRVKPSK
jgi:hypothetical protein